MKISFYLLAVLFLFGASAIADVRCSAHCLQIYQVDPLGDGRVAKYIKKSVPLIAEGNEIQKVHEELATKCISAHGTHLATSYRSTRNQRLCYTQPNCAPDYGTRLISLVASTAERSCERLRTQVGSDGTILLEQKRIGSATN